MTRATRLGFGVAVVPGVLALLLGACSAESSDGSGGNTPVGSGANPSGGGAGSVAGGTTVGGAAAGSSSNSMGGSGVSVTPPAAGAGGSASATGGSASSTGGVTSAGAATGGSSSAGASGAPPASAGPGTTPDLIGPGGPTCGNANATHDDGWICLLSAPAAGSNVVGAWFDYAWPLATSCTHKMKKPSGGTREICFSGGACEASAGAGVGFSVCDVHGVDVSTWPEMQQLIASHGLSSTGKSAFSACNTGAKITTVSWTASGAGTPAGMSVVLQDAADKPVGRIDNIAAGATSAMVPAGLDTTKVASVHFQLGATVKSWDFCLSKVTLGYQ